MRRGGAADEEVVVLDEVVEALEVFGGGCGAPQGGHR